MPLARKTDTSAALGLLFAAWLPDAGNAADTALGQYLSSECVTCHQVSGRYDGIPPIVGWPQETFVQIMNEYRSKRRANPVMQTIASRLSADETAALAAYFASLVPNSKSR